MSEYHIPVLLNESLDGLAIRPDGIYVDVTFGGGGHSREILNRLDDKGHLFVFDQDEDAVQNLWGDDRMTLINSNFRYITRWMKYYNVDSKIDGILADLGVSSYQFDNPQRGFSYRFDEALDMRMNQKQTLTAADVLNEYDVQHLQEMFSQYGEITNAKTLAQQIVQARTGRRIETTGQLVSVAEAVLRGHKMQYLSQLFQALRIEINDEMNALKDMLKGAEEVLKPGGRLSVISYHSLEDRLVKRFFKSGNFEGEPETDFFGKRSVGWKVITKNPIEADVEEQARNPRSRSGKLRVAEKAAGSRGQGAGKTKG
ncbi:MAG: 16S rRNA (cytosine(1402)-N(4))-methyltransferase RsmH [Saprospiraceae bacterium]|uniref:Ribosomal RNA small subunit methyltransferase H n=1 Tax=Candidatus Opimibacter skivensis TaxID=2982028 RepID=A0A9D7STQ3_9BACT|nr:16S rRNA (cytosine(1402)-N(4))-methyltransferase RsmH [Candidatus Opimibacter skivensis]